MKSIKDHIMFILPLMAMLIGIEFVLIFDRITNSFEEKLKNDYAVLVVSKKELNVNALRNINEYIDTVRAMDKEKIANEVIQGVKDKKSIELILKELPLFYKITLTDYLPIKELNKLEKDLKKVDGIISVETFGKSYNARRSLFRLIESSLNVFITILFIVSLLLIIKQMEVWQLAHKERMQIMEIFGAPLMLRSGVLFKMAVVDAMVATILNLILFSYIKSDLSQLESLKFLEDNKSVLFSVTDMFIWFGMALFIVIISVFYVAFKASEVSE